MSGNTNFVVGMIFGFVFGLLTMVISNAFSNREPIERPMELHCQTYDSELRVYDGLLFECTNGAIFRHSVLLTKGGDV